jgi:formylglycine-generating enzyme required for sulfatase activity
MAAGWGFLLVACRGAAIAPLRPSLAAPPPAGAPPVQPEKARPALAAPPEAPACPDGMVRVAAFCVDRYEAPNRAGATPLSMQTAADAEAYCGARGKRLCTESEWIRACQGPSGWLYPYGEEHRASACNDDRTWRPVDWARLARWPDPAADDEAARLFQGEPSGARPACVSYEGVYDLTGNVAEWVRKSEPDPRPSYQHVLKGCYWAGCYHEPHPNCLFRNSAHPGTFRTYEAGFRCCAD